MCAPKPLPSSGYPLSVSRSELLGSWVAASHEHPRGCLVRDWGVTRTSTRWHTLNTTLVPLSLRTLNTTLPNEGEELVNAR
jgi:hypothetical protein